jgi:hypothetical protein
MTGMGYQRPRALYRNGNLELLQRALELGEFRLQPHENCLTLGFSMKPEVALAGSSKDACLIIHQPEAFGEQLHRAVARVLPNWAGIDGAVEYGKKSRLGATFSKNAALSHEKEWLFAWRPMQAAGLLQPLVIQMGDVRQWAELRANDTYLN